MLTKLENRCLYIVIGKIEKGKRDYLRAPCGPTAEPDDVLGCLNSSIDGFFYDLYFQEIEGHGTIYRMTFRQLPQLIDRWWLGRLQDTEGEPTLLIRPRFSNITKSRYVVGMVKIFEFSAAAQKIAEATFGKLATDGDMAEGDLVPSVHNWTLGMLKKVDENLHAWRFAAPDEINYPLMNRLVLNFARKHEDIAARGEADCPILDLGRQRSYTSQGSQSGTN